MGRSSAGNALLVVADSITESVEPPQAASTELSNEGTAECTATFDSQGDAPFKRRIDAKIDSMPSMRRPVSVKYVFSFFPFHEKAGECQVCFFFFSLFCKDVFFLFF